MFVTRNTLKAIKEYFFSSLKNKYEKMELESLYLITAEEILNLNRTEIRLDKGVKLLESELLKFNSVIKGLKKDIPIQQLFGKAPFYEREFVIDENVLIPRQETEELIQLIVEKNKIDSPRILDIGTGSGAIAISLNLEINNSKVYALDVSEKALDIAKKNKELLNGKVEFLKLDILKESSSKFTEKLDLIVSNPPYVLNSEKELMLSNVLDYEPHLALFVEDANPLIFYKKIVDFALINLVEEGILYFEINEKYGEEVAGLMQNNFNKIEIIKDLNGKDRFVFGTLSS